MKFLPPDVTALYDSLQKLAACASGGASETFMDRALEMAQAAVRAGVRSALHELNGKRCPTCRAHVKHMLASDLETRLPGVRK